MSAQTPKPRTRAKAPKSPETPPAPIDRDKLRAAIRKLGDEYAFYVLDAAIDLMTPAQLANLAARYLDVTQLRPEPAKAAGNAGLLADARAFDVASRAGKYYEGFNVNSKNFMDRSGGTRGFIVDCKRLLGRCVAAAEQKDSDPIEICASLDLILKVLRRIDEGHDDVVFFADEGGSWQVGVNWKVVLPAWFTCLARTVSPAEYERQVVEVVDWFDRANRDKHLAVARTLAAPAKRK